MPRKMTEDTQGSREIQRNTISKTPNLVNLQTMKSENLNDEKSLEDNLYSQMLNPWGGPKP